MTRDLLPQAPVPPTTHGDNKVNVADIVQMVKAGKSQTEINEVVDIIMSE